MSYEKVKTETYEQLGGINTKVSAYVNGPQEFRDLSNLNFKTPGALTKRDGTTLYSGATVIGRITGGIEFERLDGSSFIVAAANTNLYTVGAGFNAIRTSLASGALFDFTVFVDRLFCANGTDWFKTDGTNSSLFGLPQGIVGFGATASAGGSLAAGIYVVGYGYKNDAGYLGPVSEGVTVTLAAANLAITYYGMTTPTGFGVTNIALYRSAVGSIDMFGTTFITPASTTAVDPGYPIGTTVAPTGLYFTNAPKYMEIYNNQLMVAGFSNLQSTLYWSDIGEPENIDPAFNAEFRTNDGDKITGLKSYAGSCLVFKRRSFHRYTGDNPNDPLLQEISDQYGAGSNRAIVTFENLCWFWDDQKGIIEYNGANITVVSNKIEPLLNSVNITAALDNAWALHVKRSNEIWFGFPCNGSTLINCIAVYDYFTQAWTKYEGLNLSSAWLGKGSLSDRSVIYGGYTGSIFNFGASYYGDSGQGITCYLDSRFYAVSGQTTERMYRRFYLDIDPVSGVTSALTCNFRSNYGSTIQFTETMYQNPYQSRIDFGISARSIQAEVSHYSASLPLKINGFAFESRFQRPV